MTVSIAILLYNDVEVLDFAGPFEVFSTASRVQKRLDPHSHPLFEVFTAAISTEPVRARGGLVITPSYSMENCPPVDVLVVPGGVVDAELKNSALIGWLARTASRAQITASVCTGAFLLGKAGLLQGRRAITHWEDIPDLRAMLTETTVLEDARWVDEGEIVTAAGISAGIDMSLHLVRRLAGEALARRTARQMEYDWRSYV